MASCSGEWAGCVNSQERQASPSGDLELLIKSKDCGATTSKVKKIYIVKKDKEVSFWSSPVLFAEKFENLSIVWEHEDKVTITYSRAVIREFQNNWYILENGNITHEVELILIKN